MNIFFDISSLFKLYHIEDGTQELMNLFTNNVINSIFLAEITRIEFSSVVWKKCRKKEINEKQATTLIRQFDFDSKNYSFVPENYELRKHAKILIGKHWEKGLRTLDSIQLASGLKVKSDTEYFLTSDKILSKIAKSEGLITQNKLIL